jgi:hypothetical protein
MSKYPTPPFDTKTVLIEDTFNPEIGAFETIIDFNELSNEELEEVAAYGFELATKILDFRAEQENQKG